MPIKKKAVPKKKPKQNKLKEFQNFVNTKAVIINNNMNYGKLNFQIRYLLNKGPQQSEDGKGHVIFTINSAKSYRAATLNVYVSAFDIYCDKETENNYLVDGLIHEFAHVHTSPLQDLALSRCVTMPELVEANEELTETIAMYIRENLRNKNKELKLYN